MLAPKIKGAVSTGLVFELEISNLTEPTTSIQSLLIPSFKKRSLCLLVCTKEKVIFFKISFISHDDIAYAR